MATVFLSLGSNLGERADNLRSALTALHEGDIKIIRSSSLYETEPVGLVAQPAFLNLVCQASTGLPAAELMQQCLAVERGLGRQRTRRWEPRTIDIDILFYDFLKIQSQDLTIPHPRLAQRRFVLIPMAEINPDFPDPDSGMSVGALLERCADRAEVRKKAPPPQITI